MKTVVKEESTQWAERENKTWDVEKDLSIQKRYLLPQTPEHIDQKALFRLSILKTVLGIWICQTCP